MNAQTRTAASASELWFLPLGGCGEIGMNMNLYSHDNQWLMVDCGVSFQHADQEKLAPGARSKHLFTPDPSFIAAQQKQLQGIVITHAHEDHVGAIPWLWPRIQAPIYTTAFTAEVLHRKLRGSSFADQVDIRIVEVGRPVDIGLFTVEFLTLTHSIPEANALVISTPAGDVFHTGDWKLDPQPLVGEHYDAKKLKALGRRDIKAMVCDSTNATVEGWSQSEGSLYDGLKNIIKQATGRVVVACFGSNVARLFTLANIAEDCDRHFGAIGRSLNNMIGVAKTCGYWPDTLKVINSAHLGYLPRDEVLAVATGSQGEERTALYRLARDDHFDVDLEKGDTVIFSSRTIPGNEAAIEATVKRLRAKGVHVISADDAELPIHASGHPHKEELQTMYDWIKPHLAIPVHGEERHMLANAEVARETGVPRQLVGKNGDLFQISPTQRIYKNYCKAGLLTFSNS